MKGYSCLVILMVLASWFFGELDTSYAERSGWRKKQSEELSAIRGVVKPVKEATISAELSATIKAIRFRDGQRFRRGDVLVEFICDQYRSELEAAQADYDGRQALFVNNRALADLHGVGDLELRLAEIEMKKSLAVLRMAKLAVRRCTISAPFSGRVVKALVNQHESVNPYDELLSILDDGVFDIELIIPSSAIRWLKPTSPFVFRIDENQHAYEAHVVSLGARIDPVSQTIRVIGAFDSPPSHILAGMSGGATFAEQPVKEGTVSKLQSGRRPRTRDRSRQGLR